MCVAACGLSLAAVLSTGASHCGGFSCYRAWALEHSGLVVVAHELRCPAVCGILVP